MDFKYENIEICRKCAGKGEIDLNENRLVPVFRPKSAICTCPTCKGSGRVLKKKTVTIEIEPYNGQDNEGE